MKSDFAERTPEFLILASDSERTKEAPLIEFLYCGCKYTNAENLKASQGASRTIVR